MSGFPLLFSGQHHWSNIKIRVLRRCLLPHSDNKHRGLPIQEITNLFWIWCHSSIFHQPSLCFRVSHTQSTASHSFWWTAGKSCQIALDDNLQQTLSIICLSQIQSHRSDGGETISVGPETQGVLWCHTTLSADCQHSQ